MMTPLPSENRPDRLSREFMTQRTPRGNAIQRAVQFKDAIPVFAYTLDEVQSVLSLLPKPAATAFVVAAFMGTETCGIFQRAALGELSGR
jgi:hypothetical protein